MDNNLDKITGDAWNDMSYKRPFNKNKKSGSGLTLERKIENFIIRNSQNGFFTKISPQRFVHPTPLLFICKKNIV